MMWDRGKEWQDEPDEIDPDPYLQETIIASAVIGVTAGLLLAAVAWLGVRWLL
jgi:hypothetical protein